MKTFIKFYFNQLCLLSLFIAFSTKEIKAQLPNKPTSCANSDFSEGTFRNWTGATSVYPFDTPGTNIKNPGNNGVTPVANYYYTPGIVPGRQTIITTSTPDPFTCGTVMTLPPNEKICVRLGNGGAGPWGDGVGWQRDFLNYTFQITPANALLIYKYAVVLQDPASINNHTKELRPRFIVSIKDGSGKLIDPVCGTKEDFADSTVDGYRQCAQTEAEKLGGKVKSDGDIVYRAWTTVGVDLRKFIGQNVTIEFETWDCGLGGHFGYAYLMAKCDSLGIIPSACSGNGAVRLTAPEGFAYLWSTGQTTRIIDIANAKPGDEVSVQLTTVSGCKTSLSTKIYPMFTKAAFTQSADSVCMNTPVTFDDKSYSIYTNDNSNVPIVDWLWNFGDGTTATTKTASHSYKAAGTYKIILTVTNKNGCQDTVSKKVVVIPAPIANFYFDDICKNGTAEFFDVSTKVNGGPVTSGWFWTFGDDNTTSTLQNPTHVFKNEGTFAVKLKVSELECADDTTAYIKVFPLPEANYTISEVCVGSPTTFTDQSVKKDNADNINRWIWNFGDKSALSSLQNPTHTYAKEGTYTTTLIITTKLGCVGTLSKDVIVRPHPTAKFTATPLCLSEPVRFTDKSTVPDPATGDAVVEWYWSFKDRKDGHSTLQNPINQYDTSSVYYPTLVVKSKYGCIDSTKIPLNLPPLPFVNFDADKYENCVPLDANLLDFSFSSSDKIKTWEWNFGDGSGTDTTRNPHHKYEVPGVFDVTLNVTTANGCKATFTWKEMMKVWPNPVAAFSYTPTEPTEADNLVSFKDEAIDAVFWSWDFGDAGLSPVSVSIDQNPFHKFPGSGTYTIWQYVTSEHGCLDKVSHDITIKPDWTFYVPNTFTPNKDGTNDGFIPKGHNIIEFQMWIFDRWGNMIYTTDKTKDPKSATPWNGAVDNGIHGEKRAQEDVYVWLVELKDINNLPHKYIGHVTLVK